MTHNAKKFAAPRVQAPKNHLRHQDRNNPEIVCGTKGSEALKKEIGMSMSQQPCIHSVVAQLPSLPGCNPLQDGSTTGDSPAESIPAGRSLAGGSPRIRVVARPDDHGNPVFWGVLDELDPGDILILTDGIRDWPAQVVTVTDILITARDVHQQWLFFRSGPRAGHIAGH